MPALQSSPAKRERRKEARPGELLSAALTLFVEKGYAATRVEEVAAQAGVSKGTLFLYFPSKAELFKAVVRENVVRHQKEGAEILAQATGPSGALLERLMLEWWWRYGATPASGISKLIMSEACNFPDLAEFYTQEVVRPGLALVQAVLQRGMDRGEFRRVDLPVAVHSVIALLMFLVTWKHSLAACMPADAQIDPETLIRHHAQWLVRGLTCDPTP